MLCSGVSREGTEDCSTSQQGRVQLWVRLITADKGLTYSTLNGQPHCVCLICRSTLLPTELMSVLVLHLSVELPPKNIKETKSLPYFNTIFMFSPSLLLYFTDFFVFLNHSAALFYYLLYYSIFYCVPGLFSNICFQGGACAPKLKNLGGH